MSKTLTITTIVPDLAGVPPSIAVNVSRITDLTLSPLCVAREKYSFWLSL
uniref:Uncharacterized protein n=1 Tax=Sparus aurata TaxID=8175 RepID=A0A671U795_SPAAU